MKGEGIYSLGMVYADISNTNGDDLALVRQGHLADDRVRRMTVSALVDSGAYMLGINDDIQAQLGLIAIRSAPARLANGSVGELEVVGPLEVRFENRVANVDAIVLPGSAKVLLGAIPMEYMDVLIDPRQQRLIVNPAHPYVAGTELLGRGLRPSRSPPR